jgi:hypothetical protein
MLVTFATCWYSLTSKFPTETYLNWMKHLLESVNNYYLVIFTDPAGEHLLRSHFAPYYFQNPAIKIVIKPCEKWHNYTYKSDWIKNHTQNFLLNDRTEWKLNMLWAEKTNFVKDARTQNYFPPTEFYGWCDIGYFREGPCPTFVTDPKIRALNKNKIYYAQVHPSLDELRHIITHKNEHGLPTTPIPPNQLSIAGGFFIAHQAKIDGWQQLFDTKLQLYFQHNYLVKDDQIIIIDCILSEPQRFELIQESANNGQNHWLQFRRFLG